MEIIVKKDYEAPSVEVLKLELNTIVALSAEYEGFGNEDDLSGE